MELPTSIYENSAKGQTPQSSLSLNDFKDRKVWVAWRGETRKKDKTPTKIPYSAVDKKAESDNSATWITLLSAEQLAPKIVNGLGGGIGIVLGIDCGDDWLLGGFDLDTCRTDGSFEDWAKQVMDRFASYTE